MTVKELIENLLDYDMDYEVEIEMTTADGTEWDSFDLGENNAGQQLYLTVDLGDYHLIDKDRYEELLEAESELDEKGED
ncbi:hypothetical protein [Virgibacillus sediminis]|uniref:DUF1292 domain-containing protein n=1 Tax=Virgibacillus sediminis TaxID=202260 RepID=A0ABV7A6A9_9BACI